MEEKINKLNKMLNDYIVNNDLEHNPNFQNIWLFYDMSVELNEILKDFTKVPNVRSAVEKSQRVDFFEKINLIKDFYRKYNINVDVDKLIVNGTINFIESNINENQFYYNGRSSKDNGHKSITAPNNGTIADIPIIIHELGHFRNQLDGEKSTSVRELFTEALARTDELLFLDYLKEFGFEEEIRKFTLYLFQCSACNVRATTPILKMFLLFDELGDISLESYKMYYKDTSNYEHEIETLEKNIKEEDFFLDGYIKYLFDTYVSSYLFVKYKENDNFLENINNLHEYVNTKNIFECLQLIGLNNLDKNDRKIMLDSVKEFLTSITEEKIKTK